MLNPTITVENKSNIWFPLFADQMMAVASPYQHQIRLNLCSIDPKVHSTLSNAKLSAITPDSLSQTSSRRLVNAWIVNPNTKQVNIFRFFLLPYPYYYYWQPTERQSVTLVAQWTSCDPIRLHVSIASGTGWTVSEPHFWLTYISTLLFFSSSVCSAVHLQKTKLFPVTLL